MTAQSDRTYFTTKRIVMLAVFTALSYVLYMFVKFPVPGFPSFLDLQISDMPALLAGFMLGPSSGAAVILIKCLLKLPFTSTACVGELGDIVIGFAFVLPAAFIYKYRRTKKGALVGLIAGVLCSTAGAILVNWLVLIPFYVRTLPGGWDFLLNSVRGLFPNITASRFYAYYLPLSVLPFNLLRGIVSGLVTFLLYKSLAGAFDRLLPEKKSFETESAHSPIDDKIHKHKG